MEKHGRSKSTVLSCLSFFISIASFIWTISWFAPIFITKNCEGTSCGEGYAWGLIFGLFGSFSAAVIALVSGMIGLKKREKGDKVVATILAISFALLSATLALCFASIIILFATWH